MRTTDFNIYEQCAYISEGYIECIGLRMAGNTVFSDSEFDALVAKWNARPDADDGYEYKLRADTLEWELVELPFMTYAEEASAADYEESLGRFGV